MSDPIKSDPFQSDPGRPTLGAGAGKRLMRSRDDRMIGGVCAGIAEYFGWSPAVVRLVFVASILLPGPQVLVYLLLWLVMPLAPRR